MRRCTRNGKRLSKVTDNETMGGVLKGTPHFFVVRPMYKVKDIYRWLDEYAPFRYAQSWDQCGLQIGDPEFPVERVLVALDPSSAVIAEASERNCQCLVTHHPLIFQPLQAVRLDVFPGSVIGRAIKSGIHLIAAHTNLDAAKLGTNHKLSELLGLQNVQPLESEDVWREQEQYGGMGRTGVLPESMTVQDVMLLCERVLHARGVRMVGSPDRQVHTVAVCTGSGGGMLQQVIDSGVDVFITGDLKYHEAQRALEAGLALVDVGHFASERLIVEPLVNYLKARGQGKRKPLQVFAANCERDPFAGHAGIWQYREQN